MAQSAFLNKFFLGLLKIFQQTLYMALDAIGGLVQAADGFFQVNQDMVSLTDFFALHLGILRHRIKFYRTAMALLVQTFGLLTEVFRSSHALAEFFGETVHFADA